MKSKRSGPETQNSALAEGDAAASKTKRDVTADAKRDEVRDWRSPVPPVAIAIAKLSRIVELHHRMATALEAAVQHSEPSGQAHLRVLQSEQTRMALAFGELVTELGGSPPRSDERSSELPQEPHAMSDARDQQELIRFVHEDLDWLATPHQELKSLPELPVAMRQRVDVMLRGGDVS
ncbi:MAG: hypothetical protein IPK13_09755 [Deltaproteobacteria bacterium]|nr:hypothetical protein [Deltaproteobacteria bacterium]